MLKRHAWSMAYFSIGCVYRALKRLMFFGSASSVPRGVDGLLRFEWIPDFRADMYWIRSGVAGVKRIHPGVGRMTCDIF